MGRRLTEVSACKLRLAITSDPGLVYTKPALWGSYGISDCEQERGKKKKKKAAGYAFRWHSHFPLAVHSFQCLPGRKYRAVLSSFARRDQLL